MMKLVLANGDPFDTDTDFWHGGKNEDEYMIWNGHVWRSATKAEVTALFGDPPRQPPWFPPSA